MSITDESLAELIESADFICLAQSSPIQMRICADTAAALRELQQFRDAVSLHNNDLDSVCNWHQNSGRCDPYKKRKRNCPNCPRDYRIDVNASTP